MPYKEKIHLFSGLAIIFGQIHVLSLHSLTEPRKEWKNKKKIQRKKKRKNK